MEEKSGDDEGVSKIHKQLQKSFQVLKQCQQGWIQCTENNSVIVSSLKNISEQYECVCAISDEDPVLQRIPDLKNNLLVKIVSEVNSKLNKLFCVVNSLKEICDRLSKQCQYISALNEKLDLELESIVTGTPMRPSVAEMMENMADIEKSLLHRYWRKRHVLDSFRLKNDNSKNNLYAEWGAIDNKELHEIDNVLKLVQFFMNAKVW